MATEWQVLVEGRPLAGWTIFAPSEADALAAARREQRQGGGVGGLEVVPLRPACDLCGFRHRPPPPHLAPDSYC